MPSYRLQQQNDYDYFKYQGPLIAQPISNPDVDQSIQSHLILIYKKIIKNINIKMCMFITCISKIKTSETSNIKQTNVRSELMDILNFLIH